jgi:hypothetical protein
MKTIIICTLALLFSGQSFTQIGVVTLKKREQYYYGQWFTVKGSENRLYFIDQEDYANLALSRLLLPYELTIEDGEEDKEGDFSWVVSANNGFISTVYKISQEEGNTLIMVITEEAQEQADFVSWHEKVFH